MDAITAARELSHVIRELRDDTERNRCLAEPIVAQLRETGLCRMAVARELGGLELPTVEWLQVYEELAAAEASVAWIVWNNALPCLLSRFLDGSTRAELFGDPHHLHASSTRPSGRAARERDGYRIDGRWTLVSGCEIAEWIVLLCVVEENGKPRMVAPGVPETRFAFVRRGGYEILDTWHVGGLRGTGSHDVVVRGEHVPDRQTMSPADPSTLAAPPGRIPIICTMAAGFAAQMLGVGRSAVDTLVELTGTKVTADPGPGLRERPALLASVARAESALDAARAHLHSLAQRLWDGTKGGATADLADITTVWGAAHHAVGEARDVVETMYAAGGTSSLYTDCPLERAHRDVHAMARHIVAQDFWLADAGRVRLGMSPVHPLYAL